MSILSRGIFPSTFTSANATPPAPWTRLLQRGNRRCHVVPWWYMALSAHQLQCHLVRVIEGARARAERVLYCTKKEGLRESSLYRHDQDYPQ